MHTIPRPTRLWSTLRAAAYRRRSLAGQLSVYRGAVPAQRRWETERQQIPRAGHGLVSNTGLARFDPWAGCEKHDPAALKPRPQLPATEALP
jgi:hypothetical protein